MKFLVSVHKVKGASADGSRARACSRVWSMAVCTEGTEKSRWLAFQYPGPHWDASGA